MKFGYARVSTKHQKLDHQIDALEKEGCEEIFSESISSRKAERPELQKLLSKLRKGDVVVVLKLSRLGRNVKELINLVSTFEEKEVHFKSLQENIDTSTSLGKLVFHIFASLAEFQRDNLRDATNDGLAAARARGRMGGRPKGLSKKAEEKARLAESLYNERKLSVSEMCDYLSISRGTFYNYLRSRGVKQDTK